MNIQSRLDQFRSDNQHDADTQAKRLLASKNEALMLHVMALGFVAAKQRDQHLTRDYIKNLGQAPPKECLVPGRAAGPATVVKIAMSKRMQNAMRHLIVDVWMVGDKPLGDCTSNDLNKAINRADASAAGHQRNAMFYRNLDKKLKGQEPVRARFGRDNALIRKEIEAVYGTFRKEADIA